MGCGGSKEPAPSGEGNKPPVGGNKPPAGGSKTSGGKNKPPGGIESEITDKPKAFPANDKTLIEVTQVDLNIRKNAEAHHTDEFDITDESMVGNKTKLVIRRGQEFKMKVEFNRPYDSEKDELRIVCQFGQNPDKAIGTHVELILSDKDVQYEWGAFIKSKEGNSLNLVLNTPPTCAVGRWSLQIDVVKRSDNNVEVFRYKHDSKIYILFNPWCKDDLVYMHEEKLLGEYILKDTGFIYVGSSSSISKKAWSFGQFEGVVLDCAIGLLDISAIHDRYRWYPTAVVRTISEMVNAQDDGGVLVGNWSGKYAGGVSPLSWQGSEPILDKYYNTGKPVKYGQCWVFSALTTTVCRALGIPARSVTNFSSAHDTDGSITIDYHFDADNKPIDSPDSVWNFHVWNDVWLARPDLPAGYGGWQAIDATPQERSDGVFCMGPTSHLAVRKGEVLFPYDGQFLFAEVNADKVYWQQKHKNGTKTPIRIVKYGIGKYISTKAAGKVEREDVTHQYKFKEGSDEERAAVRSANLVSTIRNVNIYETGEADVKFDLSAVDVDKTFMGDPVKFRLTLTNMSDSKRTVDGTMTLSSMTYTGVVHAKIMTRSIDGTVLQPKEEKTIDVETEEKDYLDKLTDHCNCKMSCMFSVVETKQAFPAVEEVRIRKPHLTVTAPTSGSIEKPFKVQVSFDNNLNVSLTDCELHVEAPGIQKSIIYKQPNVNAKSPFEGEFTMTPKKRGEREIKVAFNCKQIYSVDGSHDIKIT